MRLLEEAEDREKLEVWIAVVRQSLQTFDMPTRGLETSVKGTRSGARPNSEVLVCDQARAELLVIKQTPQGISYLFLQQHDFVDITMRVGIQPVTL